MHGHPSCSLHTQRATGLPTELGVAPQERILKFTSLRRNVFEAYCWQPPGAVLNSSGKKECKQKATVLGGCKPGPQNPHEATFEITQCHHEHVLTTPVPKLVQQK